MRDYLHIKPVVLLTHPGLTAQDFNADALGRYLDDVYNAGVTEVFFQVAAGFFAKMRWLHHLSWISVMPFSSNHASMRWSIRSRLKLNQRSRSAG